MAGFVLVQIAGQAGSATENFSSAPPTGKKWLIKQFVIWCQRAGGGGAGGVDILVDIDGEDLMPSPSSGDLDVTLISGQRALIDLAGINADGIVRADGVADAALSLGGYDNLVIEDTQVLTVNVAGSGGGGTYRSGIFISGHEITP